MCLHVMLALDMSIRPLDDWTFKCPMDISISHASFQNCFSVSSYGYFDGKCSLPLHFFLFIVFEFHEHSCLLLGSLFLSYSALNYFQTLDFLLWNVADLSSSFLFLKASKDKVFVVFVFTSAGLLLTAAPQCQQKLE